MKDLKYLAAYLLPFSLFVGLYFGGIMSWWTVLFAFGLIPILDQTGIVSTENLNEEEVGSYLKNKLFDWLLYFNLPLLYASVFFTIYVLTYRSNATYEIVGYIFSLGTIIGTIGINVGHELGHRDSKFESTLSKLLYIPALYLHFFIEHNRGHHKNVSTPLDPATSRKNQNLYAFWIQSTFGGYKNAWQLEFDRLAKLNKSKWSWSNQMIRFTIYQSAYVVLLFLLCAPWIALVIMGAGIIGFLQLETINYVEHYGLQRKLLDTGRYERVRAHHSWNANYPLGRIMLYELTRHSDHHFIANKKYQILDHHEDAPELPYGYPLSVLISMIPPLWYRVMNHRIPTNNAA